MILVRLSISVKRNDNTCSNLNVTTGRLLQSPLKHFAIQKLWRRHGIAVSMMTCGPDDPGSIPRLAKFRNEVIFYLGMFMIQFNLIYLNLIGEPVSLKI